jgi:F-type H+-transporting ATPase subunit delta
MTSAIARNYARALFELAMEAATLEAVETDVRAVRDVLYSDREARDFLASRLIARPTKKDLVRDALEGKVDDHVLTMLYLLVNRARTRLLGEIAEEFERLSRLARGVRKVMAWSAFPLDEEQKARITRALEARLASRVELSTGLRPSLIGGVLAESEGQEIELSIEGQLSTLAAQLAGK